jgi:hypothetical protein
MSTKRTPLRPASKTRISDEALKIFRRMQRIRCTCGPPQLREYISRPEIGYYGTGKYLEYPPKCRGCKRWKALHDQLAEALKWQPETWQVACVPSPNGGRWDDVAVKLQRELEAALAERSPGSWSA